MFSVFNSNFPFFLSLFYCQVSPVGNGRVDESYTRAKKVAAPYVLRRWSIGVVVRLEKLRRWRASPSAFPRGSIAHVRERNGAFEGRNSIRARPSRSFVHRIHIRANRGYTLCNQATNTYPISRAHTVGNFWGNAAAPFPCVISALSPPECAPTSLSLSLSLFLSFFSFCCICWFLGNADRWSPESICFNFSCWFFRFSRRAKLFHFFFFFFLFWRRKCVRGFYHLAFVAISCLCVLAKGHVWIIAMGKNYYFRWKYIWNGMKIGKLSFSLCLLCW